MSDFWWDTVSTVKYDLVKLSNKHYSSLNNRWLQWRWGIYYHHFPNVISFWAKNRNCSAPVEMSWLLVGSWLAVSEGQSQEQFELLSLCFFFVCFFSIVYVTQLLNPQNHNFVACGNRMDAILNNREQMRCCCGWTASRICEQAHLLMLIMWTVWLCFMLNTRLPQNVCLLIKQGLLWELSNF